MNTSGAQQRLEEALELAESGRKQEAQKRFRALVAEGARLPKAAMALGVLCGERGELAERRLWLHHARQLEKAAGDPPSLRLLLNLQVDALEHNEPEQALAYGEEALALAPEDGEVLFQQSRVLLEQGRREEAQPHLDRALELLKARVGNEPEDLKAWRLLVSCELNAEHIDSSIEAYAQALALDPNHLPSLQAISRLLINRGQIDRAMPWLMNSLAIAPDDPDVLTLNGMALKTIGEINEAIPLFRQALEIDASHEGAHLLLGDCLCKQWLFVEAANVFREGLKTCPENLDLKSGLGAALRSMGNGVEALKIYKELFEKAPDSQGAFNNLMFTYSISTLVTPQEVLDTANSFWKRKGAAEDNKQRRITVSDHMAQPLKVGLLSADIGSHVVGMFLDPLLRHHDRSECQLELISMKRRYESRSEELIAMADKVHNLEGLSMVKAQDLLKSQGYDLIVDTSGYTYGSGLHLLAERCAPIQAHYIGYHATTGLPTIDWFIGDEETAASELQDQFSERLWRLSRPWLAYPCTPPFPEATSLAQTQQPIVGCFCQLSKISEATLEFWGEILRRVPEAFLALKDRGLQDPGVRELLEKKLRQQGVSPERIYFIPPVADWNEHCEFYNLLDVALDTTPWSSATTGFEALGMGVPLVAIRGNRMVSRMSSSLVKGLGRSEWVGESPEEVAGIVKKLCASVSDLRARKKGFQQEFAQSPLADGKDLSSSLIQDFRKMCSLKST